MSKIDRRHFIKLLSAGTSTPFLVLGAKASGVDLLSEATSSVFPLSVASGDPTPSGFIIWTRLSPDYWDETHDLFFEISGSDDFSNVIFGGQVSGSDISPYSDYTIKIDLDGYLQPDSRYFYRFIYKGVTSRIGRAKTSPAIGQALDSLKFAVLTCQDYTNGYYDAFRHLAEDDSVDFVIHLGDFIYETAGDPTFQSLPFEDRTFILPSGGYVALGLEDYRTLYRTYRSDPLFQRAMEQHTWIITTDDHETANDAYWDYANDTLGAPDHPYSDINDLRQLKLDSQVAWLEYVPARVQVNWDTTHPHQFCKIYRQFNFGDMVDLFMLDTRTYRTAHPCGEGELLQRYAPIGCNAFENPDQFLMGNEQRDWLLAGLYQSTARWKVLGNQTFMGRLGFELGSFELPLSVDAWDGFQAERDLLLNEVASGGIENFVVLTGDLHSHISSNLKLDFANINPFDEKNYVGVEFMTPAVTSEGLIGVIESATGLQIAEDNKQLFHDAIAGLLRTANPHIRYFNSITHGYATILFKEGYCEWESFVIDKNQPSNTSKKLAAKFRKYEEYPWLIKKPVS